MSFAFLLLMRCLIISMAVPSSSNLTDQSTLLAFKTQISSDPDHNILAKNWSTPTSFCNWFGVICSSRHNRVTALNLANLELKGTIPPHVGNLSFLVSIDLSNNTFHGQLPHQLAYLHRLKHINFGYNNLSGRIPLEYAMFPKLQDLFLNNNSLVGTIPSSLFNISTLEILMIDGNFLQGNIPQEIGNCTSLKKIYLHSNKLTGTMPNEMGNLYNLQELDLESNRITGSIPSTFFNFSMLKTINLAFNDLSGHLPLNTGHWFPNLEELYLQQNQLSGPIPDSITKASKLTIIDISFNSFSGFIPDCLGNLRNLQKLSIDNNSLTGRSSSLGSSFLISLTNCRHLSYLRLDNNPLSGSLPNSLGNLSTSLQHFYGTGCRIKGNIPREIGNLSNVIGLIVQNNELTGNLPAEIGRLQNLQDFSVAHNKLQGQIPSEMCHLQRLGYLYLRENGFSGSLPSCLDNLTSIRELFLSSNRFNSTIPSALWRLRDLLIINLTCNSLTGSLPPEIGTLNVVIKIDLSSNQLSGDMPSSIGNLKNLAKLSLSGNRLQGPIPESFGEMVALEFLNLSDNNLSGEIPKSLEKLLHLKYFNVSFNQLQGEIPNGGLFANFSPQSFMGNKALCGSTRMLVPKCSGSNHTGMFLFKYILPAVASLVLLIAFIIIFRRCYKHKAKPSIEGDLLPLATRRRVSYQELELATDGFQESNLLGTGSFGSVYKGTLSDGTTIAVKVFNLQLEGAFRSFDTESEVLRNLRHRNLVKIISSCCNLDYKALILEFMPNCSLEKWLYSHNYFLNIIQRLNIMIDVASALEYLHHGYILPVVHCDLKPSNVLLNEDMVAQLGDFGIAKLLGEGESVTQTMTLATIGYMAPEYGTKGIVSIRCDVYSYGILLMETFTRKKPIDEMFDGEMSLKNWVEQFLPDAVTQVADAHLLMGNEECFAAKKGCITSVLKLALDCSVDMAEERVGMKDVVATLKKIQLKFLKDVEYCNGSV